MTLVMCSGIHTIGGIYGRLRKVDNSLNLPGNYNQKNDNLIKNMYQIAILWSEFFYDFLAVCFGGFSTRNH